MPKTLKKFEADQDVVKLQHLLSAQGYFVERMPEHGLFETVTHENVVLFQTQHIDQNGKQLETDGVVGDKTWWALLNPSGEFQQNHINPFVPDGLTPIRQQLLDLLYLEHDRPVFEVPDGSNRSRDIDGYWGDLGIKGHPWCCAFVSWALHTVLNKYPISDKHHVGVQKMWDNARQLGMQTPIAKPGDIFIQIKSGGKGHTGFVVGVSEDGNSIYTVEGNCGNRLKVGMRHMDSISHYIDCLSDGQDETFSRKDFDVSELGNLGTR